MKIIKALTKILDTIISFSGALTCVLILLMMFSVGLDVVMRYCFARPLGWVLETTETSLLYMTFLGAAWVLRRDGHVKVDLLLNRMGRRSCAYMNFATSLLGTALCLIVSWYSARFTWGQWVRHVSMTTVLGIPNAYIVGIIPLGMFLVTAQFAKRSIAHAKDLKHHH